MADHPAILKADKGAAARLALWTLSAIVLFQSGVIVWLLRPQIENAAATPAAAPAPPVATGVGVPATAPVALTTFPALPPPPSSLPAAASPFSASLPPPPSQLMAQTPSPAVPAAVPPPIQPVPTQRPRTPSVPPSSAIPPPAAELPPISLTDHPEVDELLNSAKEMLALNDPVASKAALEALQRADLLLPEHPAVLREMALAHQKLNDGEKAKTLFARANAARSNLPRPAYGGPSTGVALAPAPTAGAFSAPAAVAGPVTLGRTRVARDFTATTGEKQVLHVELKSAPGTVIDASKITLDVFFYDLVDGKRVEQSKGDAPVWKFDEPVDFAKDNAEIVDVIYHMPRLSEAELKEHGSRVFHGFVARLHYDGQFMAETAEPRSLLTPSRGGLQSSLLEAQP